MRPAFEMLFQDESRAVQHLPVRAVIRICKEPQAVERACQPTRTLPVVLVVVLFVLLLGVSLFMGSLFLGAC